MPGLFMPVSLTQLDDWNVSANTSVMTSHPHIVGEEHCDLNQMLQWLNCEARSPLPNACGHGEEEYGYRVQAAGWNHTEQVLAT